MTDQFITDDIALVAALQNKGFNFRESIKKQNKVYFTFDQTAEIREISDMYYSRRLDVDAMTYSQNYQSLKRLIYAHIDRR